MAKDVIMREIAPKTGEGVRQRSLAAQGAANVRGARPARHRRRHVQDRQAGEVEQTEVEQQDWRRDRMARAELFEWLLLCAPLTNWERCFVSSLTGWTALTEANGLPGKDHPKVYGRQGCSVARTTAAQQGVEGPVDEPDEELSEERLRGDAEQLKHLR
jgi:hypothetical protein